jgi:hypothetical protein
MAKRQGQGMAGISARKVTQQFYPMFTKIISSQVEIKTEIKGESIV